MSSFSKLHAVENITSGSYMLPEFGAKGWTEVFTAGAEAEPIRGSGDTVPRS